MKTRIFTNFIGDKENSLIINGYVGLKVRTKLGS